MNRTLLTLLVASAAAGCSDQSFSTGPAAPSMPAVAATVVPTSALADAVADVLDRIVPALGDSPAAAEARGALRMLDARLAGADALGARAAIPALDNALDRLERADPSLAAEVDAIRLGLAQQ